jgi:RimJ/RimL family protein N-acetyltransferase
MRIDRTESADVYFELLYRELGARERDHHLILGAVNALVRQPVANTLYAGVRDDRGLAVAALLAPKRPLVIATDREDATVALDALVPWLAGSGVSPRGFVVDVPHADAFVRAWSEATGVAPRIRMRQRLHALTSVADLPSAAGELHRATAADVDFLARWQREFDAEALGEGASKAPLDPEMRDAMSQRVQNGEMYLWIDGEPRGMAASARPTPRGVAVNSVYTPPRFRGKGYATTAVASLSRQLLRSGKEFCVLYTDIANPTSNAIYGRIGYHPVSDSILYDLPTVGNSP